MVSTQIDNKLQIIDSFVILSWGCYEIVLFWPEHMCGQLPGNEYLEKKISLKLW